MSGTHVLWKIFPKLVKANVVEQAKEQVIDSIIQFRKDILKVHLPDSVIRVRDRE